MLYLVATPIGNLGDITFRAIETLKSVDLILCEDTRYSSRLLKHFNIQKPCKSFHKFNETYREAEILDLLKSGKTIALISDAGTPGISDPGENIVKRCVEEKILVTSIPGACAAISALCSSGLDTEKFQFCGFLPKKEGELRKALLEILEYKGTSICYESPNRIKDSISMIAALQPTRYVAIAKELTKIHEKIIRGQAIEVLKNLTENDCRGEIVLLIEGNKENHEAQWQQLTPEEHVVLIQDNYKISKQEAIKMAASQRGVSKRDIYKLVHHL